jgi:threonine dehydrogenase-like Zn-dependent dehydrogenase
VDQTGAAVQNCRRGDRVALLSQHAYAEYDIAEAINLVAVPENATIFPGEALGCAVNAMRRSDIEAGQTVAVIGVGFLGAVLVQLLTRAHAEVIAISRRPFALEIARRCGAVETIELTASNRVIARIMERTGGLGCERVIEAAGEQEAIDLASELVRVRGRLVIAGYHQDSSRRVNMQLWNWRGIDVINAHERDPQKYVDGMRTAADQVALRQIETSLLYTHSYPLEKLAGAFAALEERPDRFLKAWIRFAETQKEPGSDRKGTA